MSELWVCDWCMFPEPDKECPLHGPAAVRRIGDGLRALADEVLADLRHKEEAPESLPERG